MQTISIDIIVPQGWHELSDKQLRYVYQLLADEFSSDKIKFFTIVIGTSGGVGVTLRHEKDIRD